MFVNRGRVVDRAGGAHPGIRIESWVSYLYMFALFSRLVGSDRRIGTLDGFGFLGFQHLAEACCSTLRENNAVQLCFDEVVWQVACEADRSVSWESGEPAERLTATRSYGTSHSKRRPIRGRPPGLHHGFFSSCCRPMRDVVSAKRTTKAANSCTGLSFNSFNHQTSVLVGCPPDDCKRR